MSTAKFILRDEGAMARAAAALFTLDINKDVYQVTIKPYRRDRSGEQNDFMWAMHRAASRHTGHSSDELHAWCCAKFLGTRMFTLQPGGAISVPYSTTNGPNGGKLTVEEMSHFLEQVRALYTELGVSLDQVHGQEAATDQR